MMFRSNPERRSVLLAGYIGQYQNRRDRMVHCLCAQAIIFSVTGILVAINFGITLIAIAAAILYYNRFGHKTAIQMGALLIIIVVPWMTIMPAHHLAATAISILIIACTGRLAGHIQTGSMSSVLEDLRYLPAAPIYTLARLKEKLARTRHLDPL